jgi:hypothetical protein
MRTEYRGTGVPTVIGATTRPPLWSPMRSPAVLEPREHAVKGYPTSDVLAASLARWSPVAEDGITHPSRVRPQVKFAGIGRECGALTFEKQCGRDVGPTSEVTLGPDGRLLFSVGTLFYCGLVSATIDSSGALTNVAQTNTPTWGHFPPLLTANGYVLCGGVEKSSSSRLGQHGSLRKSAEVPAAGAAARMPDERFLVQMNGMLSLTYAKPDGGLSKTSSAPLVASTGKFGGISFHNGHVVVTTDKEVASYSLSGTSLKRIEGMCLHPEGNAIGCSPAAFVGNIGIVVERQSGLAHTFLMRADGTLKKKHTRNFGKVNGDGVVTVGNIAVFGSDNSVRTVTISPNGEMTPIAAYPTNGRIIARPTITQDGVVLVGAQGGRLYALQLDGNGNLSRISDPYLGGAIDHPVTVTQDGYVLVVTESKLLALKD